jgi:hypothetical protein
MTPLILLLGLGIELLLLGLAALVRPQWFMLFREHPDQPRPARSLGWMARDFLNTPTRARVIRVAGVFSVLLGAALVMLSAAILSQTSGGG